MILTCDKCGKEYRFPDYGPKAHDILLVFKGMVLLDAPHATLPVGKGCDGVLRSETKLASGEVEWRKVA